MNEQGDEMAGEAGEAAQPEGLPDRGLEEGSKAIQPVEKPAMPLVTSDLGGGSFVEAASVPPQFLMGKEGAKMPVQVEEPGAQEDLVKLFVTRERLISLWQRADDAEKKVIEKVFSQQTARNLQDQVKHARNELMGGKDHYEEAARFVGEVEYRVVQVERNRIWARNLGIPIFLYELIIGAALVAIFILFFRQNALVSGSSDLVYLAVSMLVGGFGGVLGAWLSLVKHIAIDQDFEGQHQIWYYTSPLTGLGVGAFIFMVMRVGFVSLMSADANISSPYLFYILSFLGGYQHNVFTDIVKRVLKVFESSGPESKETPAAAQRSEEEAGSASEGAG